MSDEKVEEIIEESTVVRDIHLELPESKDYLPGWAARVTDANTGEVIIMKKLNLDLDPGEILSGVMISIHPNYLGEITPHGWRDILHGPNKEIKYIKQTVLIKKLEVLRRMKVQDVALKALNSAFQADPKALTALIENRVPCNEALANHPTVQVAGDPNDTSNCIVGMLGILNSVIEELSIANGDGPLRVAISFDDETGEVKGFVPYDPSTEVVPPEEPTDDSEQP